MKKNGKNLERLVRIVEEVYKTNSSTQIFSNHKITNTAKNRREIDILIKSRINEFDIIIAIECKEYNKTISANHIESFYSKCQRIPNINKKIFVSEKGFQKDAIAGAKDFGVELYTFSEIESNPTKILGFPINEIKPKLSGFTIYEIHFDKPLLEETVINNDSIFSLEKTGEKVMSFLEIFKLSARPYWVDIAQSAGLKWLTQKQKNKVLLELRYDSLYLIFKSKPIKIQSIVWGLIIDIIETEAKTTIREFTNFETKETKAKTFSFNLGTLAQGNIVVDKNNNLHFFDTTNSMSQKLGILYTYDPNTGKITPATKQ